MKKKPKKRTRGTASLPCPRCKATTRVLRTSRDTEAVIRERICTGKSHHRFKTTEHSL